ncbi:MAG TPA: diaminopimelate epimerase [Thermoanaerobaculia bacterium]|nr:diaminopimelate epimerase [Thermoanaerobaculia bacterium]
MERFAGNDPRALRFAKMAGGGNDFVVIDNRSGEVRDPSGLTRRICTRRLSVGADGLILVEPSEKATFRMRYYNADGSLADFCANGTRCAARFAALHGIAPPAMTIETGAGEVPAEVAGDGRVTLKVPEPANFRADRPLTVDGTTIRGSSILVGVPHYVVFAGDDLWSRDDIVRTGRAIRHHRELQPEGANVDFVAVKDMHSIEVRTYERGVEDETLSCGSGVVASVAVSALAGRVAPPVSVLTRSGIAFDVSFALVDGEVREVRLSGDARLVYEAALTPETIAGFDPDFVRAGGFVAAQDDR